MGICLRTAQHFVHPVNEPFGHRVLEMLGILVNLVPVQSDDLHEEQLD